MRKITELGCRGFIEQCVALHCSACVAVWCGVLQCCSVVQCGAVWCSVVQCVIVFECMHLAFVRRFSQIVKKKKLCRWALQCGAVWWQCGAVCCRPFLLKRDCHTLVHTATHCNALQFVVWQVMGASTRDYSTLQHTATHCSTLQHAHHTLQHTATHYNWLFGK